MFAVKDWISFALVDYQQNKLADDKTDYKMYLPKNHSPNIHPQLLTSRAMLTKYINQRTFTHSPPPV